MTALANKAAVHGLTLTLAQPGWQAWAEAYAGAYMPDAQFRVVHPVGDLNGPDEFLDGFLGPLSQSFVGLHRRDDILIGGHFDGADWVSTHGNFVGHFAQDWLGITATGRLEYLRFGEFHRMEGGQIAETTLFLDIPQLMIAAGQWPIADSPGRDRGYTGFIPGPASQDGLVLWESDADRSEGSRKLVEDMLAGLATENEAWRPYWHDTMMWYGPAAFGSFVGVENFAGFQVPFEQAFSTWSGGSSGNGVTRHFCRFGDGEYICTAGWPSLMCVQAAPFLGQPSKGDTLLMRVCDWWRRQGDLLVENWVFVDIPDVLLQMGVDLFAGRHTVTPGPRLAG